MGLTCECNSDWYPEPGDWFWPDSPDDYKTFPFKRRRACCSCGELIGVGAIAVEFERVKAPKSNIEIVIYGDDGQIPIASDWMCERCGDLYFSIEELGYCVTPREDMRELAKEYARQHRART